MYQTYCKNVCARAYFNNILHSIVQHNKTFFENELKEYSACIKNISFMPTNIIDNNDTYVFLYHAVVKI